MNYRKPLLFMLVAASSFALTACAGAPEANSQLSSTVPPSVSPATSATPAPAPSALPTMLVNKSPSCGCCGSWIEHVEKAGFKVEINDTEDMNPIKERVGVPYGKGSCHTAEVGGYFIEGHVPAEDIKRLLAERPDAKGLTVPGMPAGSPGMELPDGRTQRYTVELVANDGTTSAYAQHGD